MAQFPGLDLIKAAFKKFADKHDTEDLALRVVRSGAAGVKATADKLQVEFPQPFVKAIAADFYSMIASQDVADGISMAVRSFDEEKVSDILSGIVDQLKDQKTSEELAQKLKEALQKVPMDDIEANLGALMGGRSPIEQMMFQAVFNSQIRPQLEDIRDGSIAEGAERIREMADMIPTDDIAAQVGNLTRNITPEVVGKQTHNLVGKLPSPNAVANIAQGVAEKVSETFNNVSNAKSLENAKDLVAGLAADVGGVIESALNTDAGSKKTFGKKKGGNLGL
jgi:hypothetical protein